MLEAALEAIMVLLDPSRMIFLFLGLVLGIVVGILPGFGGMVGVTLLLPFIYGMDPYTAMAMLIGMVCITQTADSFTAILFGVPGTSGSQATIVDGHPLALKGEAARALGAAFISSMIGGVIGGMLLFLSIPIAQPIIHSFGSPELFMLALLGIAMIGIFTGKRKLRGIIAGLFGLMLGTVGAAPAAAEYRYTFEWLYLYDGIALIVMVLGFFAIPELIGLLSSETKMKNISKYTGSTIKGLKDAIKNKMIIFQSALIGTFIGFIPGLGSSVADWAAYSVAKKTVKNENFGKGDIRGVIAPDSSTNAKEAGGLIPTLLFGIPGSGVTAVLLIGFMLLGIQPGPTMLTDNLDLTFTIVWTLVIGNVFGAGICFLIAKPMSKIRTIQPSKLVPFLLVLIFVGAYQATNHWGDYLFVVCLGALGWLMRELGWPRIPFIIGIILSAIAERYLFLSMQRYEIWEMLTRPGVIIIGILMITIFLGGGIYKKIILFSNKSAGDQS